MKMYSKTYILQARKTLQKLSIRLFEYVTSQPAQGRLTQHDQCEATQENHVKQGK